MRLVFCIVTLVISALATSALAESVYLTTSARVENLGLEDTYVFVGPYVTGVHTELSLTIAKPVSANASNPSNSSNSTNAESKAAAPLILHGQRLSQDAQGHWLVAFSVSCDLQKVLIVTDNPSITVTGAQPSSYNGTFAVIGVTADEIRVNTNKTEFEAGNLTKGTITDTFCPPAATSSNSFSVNFGVTAVPASRAYLYLKKNSLFADAINISVDSNGLLSSSDTSSTQQVTAILTELAGTIGQVLGSGLALKDKVPSSPKTAARQKCFSAIADELKAGPFIATPQRSDLNDMRRGKPWTIELDTNTSVKILVNFQLRRATAGLAGLGKETEVTANVDGRTRVYRRHNGLIAFFPVPAKVTISCSTDGNTFLLAAPMIVNVYAESQFLDPQRDFFTGPQDSFTFNGGMFVSHKYSGQSPAKTVVDTITAPIRAIIPSVSVQQTTQVQTGGGKPDQTTTTTQTTTGPPKSQ